MNKVKVAILIICVCLALFVGLWAFQQTQNEGQNIKPGEGEGLQISTQIPEGESSLPDLDIPQFTVDQSAIRDRGSNLSSKQQKDLAVFAGRFAGLYQTYGYEDYNTILGLMDYFETKTGQDAARMYIKGLQEKVLMGYSQHGLLSRQQPIEISYSASSKEYRVALQTDIYQLGTTQRLIKQTTADLVLVYVDTWRIRKVSLYE